MSSSGPPKLKLRLGSKSAATPTSSDPQGSPVLTTQDVVSPLPTPTSKPKITIKKRPRDDTDDPKTPASSTTNKKRQHNLSISIPGSAAQTAIKKSTATTTPSIPSAKIKFKQTKQKLSLVSKSVGGYVIERKRGYAYDSEAEDVEPDPLVEHQFVIRMQPGEDCEFVRTAVEQRALGAGGAAANDVRLRFFDREGRRAMLSVRGRHYAGNVVDLPSVIEAHKSWDRKTFLKTADIHQILVVTKRVKDVDEARKALLPEGVAEGIWQYPHGLTPPMHWVRKRRFRKRINRKTIEAVEDEVERLLRIDAEVEAKGGSTEAIYFDPDAKPEDQDYDMDDGDVQDSIEVDGDGDGDGGLEDEMMALFGNEGDDDNNDDDEAEGADTPMTGHPVVAGAPVVASPDTLQAPSASQTHAAGDESSGDDFDDDVSDDDMDEDERAAKQAKAEMEEEVEAIRTEIGAVDQQIAAQTNKILVAKLQEKKDKLKRDLDIKLKNLGEDEDEEDD